MREILLEPRFDNRERFTQMVMEEKARLEQSWFPPAIPWSASAWAGTFRPPAG